MLTWCVISIRAEFYVVEPPNLNSIRGSLNILPLSGLLVFATENRRGKKSRALSSNPFKGKDLLYSLSAYIGIDTAHE